MKKLFTLATISLVVIAFGGKEAVAVGPQASFVDPTPADGATITDTSVEIKVSILEESTDALTDVLFNWNGSDYSLYDVSLVLMFNFDKVAALGEAYTAGGVVKDLSGAGNDGYLYNSPGVPQWIPNGKYGGAFDFTGNGVDTGQSILVYHSDSLNPGSGDFAIVVWILTKDDYDGDVLRKGSTNSTTTPRMWYKLEHSPGGTNNRLSLNFNTDGTDATINSTSVYNDYQWHFVVAQRRGSQAELWIDGVLDKSAFISGNISNTANLAVGSKDTQNDDFINATLDEVRIYMRSFSAQEIQQLYYSNLYKYDIDKWTLYVNQSDLTDGIYTYQAFASDAGTTNWTEQRTLDIVYLPLKGPYLQQVTTDSIVIMWETDTAMTSRVDFGLTAPDEFFIEDSAPVTIHEMQLTGLTPDTAYYYTVTSDGRTSTTYTFATAPDTERSYRFVAYGDTRTYPTDHTAVIQAIINSAPEFIIHIGDLVHNGQCYDEWSPQFFDPARGLLVNTPIFPVMGNHEYSSVCSGSEYDWFFDFFSLPNNEQWYAFTYGNVRFIGLNTMADLSTESPQYVWLEAELQSAEYNDATWHIVFFHHPPYTAVEGKVEDEKLVQDYLVPLFEQYNVDIAFSGHCHVYERYFHNGIFYIVTGGGGAPLHSLIADTEEPIREIGESVLHHCVIDVTSTTLTCTTLRNDGSQIDQIFITIDATPPEITNATGDTSGTTGDSVTIQATITDNDDVASATVHYTPIDGTETTVPMAEGTGDVWSADVPVASDKVGTVTYYITAEDASGNPARDPVDPGTYNITVTDNDAPTITGSTGDATANTGETVLISATITDNIDVLNATVHYTPLDSGETTAPMTEGADNVWSASIPAGSQEGTIPYYITADDAVPNTATEPPAGSYTITVTVPDTEPPVISAVASSNVTTSSATITWTTDEASDSVVVYGTVTPPSSQQSDAAMVTAHSVTLTGLSAGTTYYFEVKSTDAVGNTSTDNNGGAYYEFTTETQPSTLFSDGFESGNFSAGGWTTSGDTRVGGSAYTGGYAAKIKKVAWIEKAISTVGFANIHVTYARKTKGFDAGEYLFVEWSTNGSDWYSLEATQDTSWAVQDVTCGSGGNNHPNFRLRFRTNTNREEAYIDDVEITGTPIGPDTAPPSPNPMTWATVPYSTGETSIAMVATTASDQSGVEYYFACTAGGGYDSGWQDSPTYEDTGLTAGTEYTYKLQARDKSSNQNETGWSSPASATPVDAPPSAPTGLVATLGDSQVSLDWDDNTESDLAGYNVYRSDTPGGPYTQIAALVATSDYLDLGLVNGTTYYYVVTAVDRTSNESLNSSEESATPGVTDVVTITKAEYRTRRQVLTVQATSSQGGVAVLTVVGYGTMTYKAEENQYQLRLTGVASPGASVTVTSSLGGSATAPVTHK